MLQATVAGIVQAAHAHGVLRAAVHVVDLESCERFTVAPEERFEPGSLFKVPVAVAWVRLSGTSKLGMDRQLLSDHPAPVVEFANPEPEVLKQGQSYPVHFLLEHMLVDSSNDALAVLGPHVPPTVFAEIWAELGIGPMPVGKTPEVRVGDVAAMFQALYDGTWLNRAGSELVLSWLLRSTWRNGLVSKLPTSAEVAHKFGIRYLHDPAHPETLAANAPALHLSECGILYQAKRPMLVCIMTEATSDAAAEGLIGDVGKAVWDWAATLARG